MAVSGSSIVAEAEKFLGHAYVWGAAGPDSFDCSGLVQYVLHAVGVRNAPRTSEQQYAWTQRIQRGDLQPGDLVFGQFPGDNAAPGHVGIYVGNGKILDAEDPALGVRYSTLAGWGSHVYGYGRVPGTAAAAGGGGGPGVVGQVEDELGGVAHDIASFVGAGFSWPGRVIGLFSDLDQALGGIWHALTALFNPATWVRVAAGLGGLVLLGAGLFFLIRAAA